MIKEFIRLIAPTSFLDYDLGNVEIKPLTTLPPFPIVIYTVLKLGKRKL
jgi:hypothetical protein